MSIHNLHRPREAETRDNIALKRKDSENILDGFDRPGWGERDEGSSRTGISGLVTGLGDKNLGNFSTCIYPEMYIATNYFNVTVRSRQHIEKLPLDIKDYITYYALQYNKSRDQMHYLKSLGYGFPGFVEVHVNE